MSDREQYTPGPASGAEVRKDGEKWTLILVRELRHSPEKVWQALTDPAHLREWAPFDADGSLGNVGTAKLTWVETATPLETRVTRADVPKVLEYNDTRWELEAFGGGTRLTLWHKIDRRFISMGAAGWHICFDVLDRLLSATPIGRIAGGEAMKFGGWQRLNAEYAKQFGVETPELAAQRPEGLKRGRKNSMESSLQKPALVAARTTPKAETVVYWIATALFSLQMSFTAYAQLRLPQVADEFTHLGFPAYFRVELSWAKLLGVVLMLAPVPARLKEWAYAGFAINLASALIAHLSVGDGPEAWGWAAATGVLWGLSYFFWRRLLSSRKRLLPAQGPGYAQRS